MTDQQFADHLAGLPRADLTGILEARPDALLEPAPRSYLQLAQRLNTPTSVVAALWQTTRDSLTVGQAVVALGSAATLPLLASRLDADAGQVDTAIQHLTALGLAWADADRTVRLVDRLAEHWQAELGGAGPIIGLATYIRVEELRVALGGLGVSSDGMKKAQLVAALHDVLSDRLRVVEILASLDDPDVIALVQLATGDLETRYGYLMPGRSGTPANQAIDRLRGAGLVFRSDWRLVVPDEVIAALYLLNADLKLTGPPLLPAAGAPPEQASDASRSAAEHALRAMVSMLDDAAQTPIAALKKGGIGTRERARLAKQLALPADELPLWLDVASAAGLLRATSSGYEPSDRYADWRQSTPARQWASLALAWLGLEHSPLGRGPDEPPPLGVPTAPDGAVRRRLLPAALPDLSVAAVGREAGWFCPMLHEARGWIAGTTAREAELLGVVALDAISKLGRQLLEVRTVVPYGRGFQHSPGAGRLDPEAVADLAQRCEALLTEAPCSLLLQSDLTAVMSGRPAPGLARLLRAAAVAEARGSAEVWRFTPASVREALDEGWTTEQLTTELTAAATHGLPQALTQLFADVARRHGEVRVREVHSCLVATEALATEIRHTKALARLQLAQPAPTILTSPEPPAVVLTALRAAGFLPVAEDGSGAIQVPAARGETIARPPAGPASRRSPAPAPASLTSRRISPQALIDRLRTVQPEMLPVPPTYDELAKLTKSLNEAEIELLAEAIGSQGEIVITYADKNDSVTVRQIQPRMLYGRWIDAWCRLRNGQRDFAVAGIQAVSPVG